MHYSRINRRRGNGSYRNPGRTEITRIGKIRSSPIETTRDVLLFRWKQAMDEEWTSFYRNLSRRGRRRSTRRRRPRRRGGSGGASRPPPEAVSIFVSFRWSHSLAKFHWSALSSKSHYRIDAVVIISTDARVCVRNAARDVGEAFVSDPKISAPTSPRQLSNTRIPH